jgi:DNA-directed RNA polymerase
LSATITSIEDAARKAIGTGKMQRVLNAINVLQAVPFTINLPILDYMERADDIPALDAVTAAFLTCSHRLYVPLNIDFRSRIYGASHFNFQREDHIRGLFLFADGEPIGEQGLLRLKAHVAPRADGTGWSTSKKPFRSRLRY